LNDPSIYRDLRKPVGALNEGRIEKMRVIIILNRFDIVYLIYIF